MRPQFRVLLGQRNVSRGCARKDMLPGDRMTRVPLARLSDEPSLHHFHSSTHPVILSLVWGASGRTSTAPDEAAGQRAAHSRAASSDGSSRMVNPPSCSLVSAYGPSGMPRLPSLILIVVPVSGTSSGLPPTKTPDSTRALWYARQAPVYWSDPSLFRDAKASGDGDTRAAKQILTELITAFEERYVSPVHLAIICAGLGDKEAALNWIEQAYDRGDPTLCDVMIQLRFQSL